jgi:hypothetical protein
MTGANGENVRYGISVGSMTGAGLTSCSGGTNAVTWNSSTNQFGCNTISGGSSSSLAVTNGVSGNAGVNISSPTANINFSNGDFVAVLQGGGTAYVTLNPNSNTFIENQNGSFQSGNFVITGTGEAQGGFDADNYKDSSGNSMVADGANSSSIFLGVGSLPSNISILGADVCIGPGDCPDLTSSGSENICAGAGSCEIMSSGNQNTVIGANSANLLTSGTDNFIGGYRSATALTTGIDNVCIGNNACDAYSDTAYNTAVGAGAGDDDIHGWSNTCIGDATCHNLQTSSNTIIGSNALGSVTENSADSRLVYVGFGALSGVSGAIMNAIAIGYDAQVQGSSQAQVGGTNGSGNEVVLHVSSVAVDSLPSGKCVQTTTGGQLTTTDSACGSGGITTLTGDVTASGTGSVAATAAANQPNILTLNASSITVTGKALFNNTIGISTTGAVSPLSIVDTTSDSSTIIVAPTWNNATETFNGILEEVTNTNSSASSNLLNLLVGGTSEMSVTKAGLLTTAGQIAASSVCGAAMCMDFTTRTIQARTTSANPIQLIGGTQVAGVAGGELDLNSATQNANPGGVTVKTSTSSITISNSVGAGLSTVMVSSNGWVMLSTGPAGNSMPNENSRFSINVSTSNEKYALLVGTTTGINNQGLYDVAITTAGHFTALADSPTISGCGTGPTGKWTDQWGWITPGSTASGCTITFAIPYNNAPACVVTERTDSLVNALSYTVSASAIVVSQTSFTSTFDYHCAGVGE